MGKDDKKGGRTRENKEGVHISAHKDKRGKSHIDDVICHILSYRKRYTKIKKLIMKKEKINERYNI